MTLQMTAPARIVTLNDLGSWRGGGTPSKSNSSFWTDGSIPWVSPKDMKSFRVTAPEDLITQEAVEGSAASLVPGPSVAVVTRSGILARTLPVAVVPMDATFNQDMKILVPNEDVHPEYVAYYLRGFERDILTTCSKNGTTVASIDFQRLKAYVIPLPPLDEQKRIVDEIETQLARLDDAVAALQRARARLKRYRASVLKAACEGRLVPIEADGSDWSMHKLGDHIERIEAGKNFRCDERPPQPNEAGIVKISAVSWGEYDEQESKTCRDVLALRDELLIQPGDFLISRANTIELVGACVIANNASRPVMLSDKVLRIRFDSEVDQRWVLFYLRSPQGRREIECRATGNQQSMRNIGQNRIKDIPIPVPPLEMQHQISDEVERRLSILDRMALTVETNIKRANALRQSILRMAFSPHVVDA
jgi:type I restriction enzyme S subunit